MNLDKISTGKNPPGEINVFVEIPYGAKVKYELDKDSGVIFVDRFLHTAMFFPFNYGFIPGTKGEDGDPLDALVVSKYEIAIGTVIPVKTIGLLEMEDEAGIDTKIVTVPSFKIDPFYSKYNDISELNEQTRKLIKHFFDHYKELEPGKWVKTKDFLGKEEAYEAIKKSISK